MSKALQLFRFCFITTFGLCFFSKTIWGQSPAIVKIVAQGEPTPRGGVFGSFGGFSFNDSGNFVFTNEIKLFSPDIFVISGNTITTLLADGDSIAGIGRFKRLSSNSFNNAGTVAFGAQTSLNSSTKNGLFLSSAPGISNIVYEGDPTASGAISSPSLRSYSLNNAGAVVFQGFFSSPSRQAIFLKNVGFVSTIVVTGDPTPLGGTFRFGFLNLWDFNDVGTVLFGSEIENGNSTKGLFTVKDGVITKVIAVGDLAPDGKKFNYIDNGPSINNLGDVIFEASVGPGFNVDYTGLFLFSNGKLSLLAKTDEAAPGGGKYSVFSGPLINDAKQIVFEASVDGGSFEYGFFAVANGVITKIVAKGDPTPLGGTFSNLSGKIMNAGGALAFLGFVTGGSAASGIFLWGDRAQPATSTVCVWQEFPIYRGSVDFSANKESNIVTFDKQKAEIISASKDSLIVRVPPELVGNRNNVLTLPDTTLREIPVMARVVRAPGDTVTASESRVRFCPPYLLLYDEVTRPAPPLVQQVMPGRGPRNRQAFLFLGNQNDGTAAVRVLNTSAGFPQPSTLLVKVIAPSGELFDKSSTPTIGNLLNIGQNNAGIQFPVTQTGIYIIIVEADRTSSFGRFPTLFQIHLAGNAGLPRRLINGNPEPPRAIRLTTLFNHPAPQPEILANAAPGFGRFAETALFKFANPVSTSQFPIAVLIPPAIDPAGFPLGIPPVRAAAPLVLGRLPNGLIDITVPSATTPGAANPVPGTVVDFTQAPIPASVLGPGPPPGVAAILGAADGTGVTLPITLTSGGVITSLIVDIGSGNEIVNGSGADFRVLGISGAYAVAVSNTPFSNTFVALGSGSGQQDFDLSATGLTSIRYIRLTVPTGTATIDAIQSLHFFVDTIHPTAGPLADVGFATITMRRQKSPATSLDCLLELIAPDGSFQGKNESGFGDETSQDRSDAALIQMQLTQQGFYRYLGRGYDTQPDEQAFGNFFTRLETAGNYDKAKIQISSQSESQTVAQKRGLIDSPRQRDSFLFEAAPGTTLSLVVNGVSNPSPALADPLIELYDPEDFLIAANDNFSGRGKNAALTVTLPTLGHAGGAFPNPSTYRIVVSGIDGESGPPTPVSNGVAHLRKVNGGNYELKVFTGALAGGAAPAIVGIAPNIAAQGATNVAITINGNNFVTGARVTFSESGITTKTLNFVSSSQLQATIDIDVTAAIGRRNVIVTNPDAQSGTGTGVFEIRKSLGTSVLSWEAPPSGQTLAPPANLKLQFGGSLQAGKEFNQKRILPAEKRRPSGSSSKAWLNFTSSLILNSIAEIEPNNKPEQAQVLAGVSPLVVNGRAEVKDDGDIIIAFADAEDDLEDLFKVTTTAPGLTISLDGFASDCDLYLFNSDLSEIIDASNTVDVNPPEEIDLPDLAAGTYFIAVSIYDPDPIGKDTTAYVLTLQGQLAGKTTLQSYNIFRSTSANAKSTGTRVGVVNAGTASFTDPVPHTGNFFYQVTAVYDQGESGPSNEATVLVTKIEDKNPAVIPVGFDLRQNYPNPFNPETQIQFDLPKSSYVKIEIFNVQGQKIRTLVKELTLAGLHTVNWDGRMDNGEPAVSGIYVYRFQTQEYVKSRKLLLLR